MSHRPLDLLGGSRLVRRESRQGTGLRAEGQKPGKGSQRKGGEERSRLTAHLHWPLPLPLGVGTGERPDATWLCIRTLAGLWALRVVGELKLLGPSGFSHSSPWDTSAPSNFEVFSL